MILELEVPEELSRFALPEAVAARLHDLLDKQDRGEALTAGETGEAEGLVNVAEFLSLLKLRAESAVKATN